MTYTFVTWHFANSGGFCAEQHPKSTTNLAPLR